MENGQTANWTSEQTREWLAPDDTHTFAVGEKPLEDMSDRELAMETLFWLRETGKALAEIQKQGIGGIMKSMMSGGRK